MSIITYKFINQSNSSVWDIIDNFEAGVNDILAAALKFNGDERVYFMECHYRELLQYVIYQFTSLPLDRIDRGLDPITDPSEMADGYNQLINIISAAFGYSKKQIETDMRPYMKLYTVDDIYEVRRLQRENRLH